MLEHKINKRTTNPTYIPLTQETEQIEELEKTNNFPTFHERRYLHSNEMTQMEEEQTSIDFQYDQVINKIQELNSLLQKLAKHESLDDLADQTTPEDYMNLLSSMIYSLHSTMFCYSHLKGQEMPEEFKKVKEYFTKIKDTLAGKLNKKEQNPLQVDKEAAMRMIKAGIRQDPAQN